MLRRMKYFRRKYLTGYGTIEIPPTPYKNPFLTGLSDAATCAPVSFYTPTLKILGGRLHLIPLSFSPTRMVGGIDAINFK